MEIVRELSLAERKALLEKYQTRAETDSHVQNTIPHHIKPVLNKPHCFRVHIFDYDYADIMVYLYSQTPNPYRPLSEVVSDIKDHPQFLNRGRDQVYWLNGQWVKHYASKLENCVSHLRTCFQQFDDCFLRDGKGHPSNAINVSDGMHRLVAYGLITDMSPDYFPIEVYFGSDSKKI